MSAPCTAALALIMLAGAAPASEPAADLVILHGHVYIADGSGRFAQAVAVRDGRILAVGSDAEITGMNGPGTKVVDAGGGAVTPGLIDTHVHLMLGAATLDQVHVSGVKSRAELTQRVARYAAAHPDQAWIEGYGYFPTGATRIDLDHAAIDRPVVIRAGDGHSVLANSRALMLAGIDSDTPDPSDGRIVRDITGAPTGLLLETAQLLLRPVMPKPTQADRRRLLDMATRTVLAAGVTTVVNIGGTDDLALFEDARTEGKLGIRIAMALWLTEKSEISAFPDGFAFTSADADRFDAIRARVRSDEWLKLDMVKILLDGVIESHTAAMLKPYSDDPSTSGHANYTPAELSRIVTMMDARGWHIMTHALGDRAVRMALDAYHDAAATNPVPVGGRRHKIEHIESIDPMDVPRFGALGVTASMQPDHAGGMNDPEMRSRRWSYIGYDRSAWGWPWRSIMEAGGRVAFGSDWPVAPLNIGPGMKVAISRIPHPPVPDQKLTVAQVIDGYTRDAAWSIFVEQDRGTLTPGKRADITVFRDDIFTQAITGGDLPIAATIMDGKIVYRGDAIAR